MRRFTCRESETLLPPAGCGLCSLRSTVRRGSLLVEMVVCSVLLAVVAAVLVPGIRAVKRQRHATRFEACARTELNNQATRVHALKLPLKSLDQLALNDWFVQRYPAATLAVSPVSGSVTEDGLVPVRMTIRRPAVDHMPDFSQALVIWIAAQEATP